MYIVTCCQLSGLGEGERLMPEELAISSDQHHRAAPDGWGRLEPPVLVKALRRFTAKRGRGYWDKRLAYVVRKVALALIEVPVDVEIFGHRLRVIPFQNLTEKRVLFTPQYFDEPERELLRQALPADGIFVDVGANIGAYSFFAASCMGPHARIVAIEPQPSIYERLAANIAFNPGVPIEPIRMAVADAETPIQLFVDASNAGETSMRRVVSSAYALQTVEVPARRLFDIVKDCGLARVDALKIDIEGAEDLALIPYFEEAPKALWPVFMIIDNSPAGWQVDCIAYAQERGYQVALETELNAVLMRV